MGSASSDASNVIIAQAIESLTACAESLGKLHKYMQEVPAVEDVEMKWTDTTTKTIDRIVGLNGAAIEALSELKKKKAGKKTKFDEQREKNAKDAAREAKKSAEPVQAKKRR